MTHATPAPADGPEVLLSRWARTLEATLGLPEGSVPVTEVLDLTRDCAHNVARPAGPLGAYAAGYARALADAAAGRAGHGTPDAIPRVVELALRSDDGAAAGTGAEAR